MVKINKTIKKSSNNINFSYLNKKGQVTIFIVIGVILVLVVTFLLSNSKYELFESKETKLINQVSDIVDSCIKIKLEQGVFILGMQGGTIGLSQAQLAVPRSHIDLGFKIPSWEIKPNKVPTITSMQNELNNYVIENANNCIKSNLNSLDDVFDFEDFKELQVETKINKNNIQIESNFPISFSEKNSKEMLSIENYFLKLENNNLGDLYKLAIEIYSTEQKKDILSNLVLDQIYSSSDYSSKESMPTEGFSFSCAKKIWTKTKLKENLVNLNNNNFKFMYFVGTKPISDLYDSIFNGINLPKNASNYYTNFYTFNLEETSSTFKDYKVEISMPTTQSTQKGNPFQKDRFRTFDILPSDGEIIQSTDMKVDIAGGSIPIPCVQLFHHLYTLDYDLLIKLTDYSESGDKTIFQFPLRVQINNNAPSSETPFTLPQTSTTNTLTATDSKFCAPENRQKEEFIYAIDKNTRDTIQGANITYKCISLSCDIGSTSRATYRGFETTSQSFLKTKLPYCVGGTLTASKPGYFSTKLKIDTSSNFINSEASRSIDLIPVKSFELNENTVFAIFDGAGGKRIETEDDGMMFISIKNDEYDFESQALWPTVPGVMDKLEFLEITGLTYNVSVVVTDSESQLIGIFEIENWEPQIHTGNTLKITVPATMTTLDETNFIDFYEISNKLLSGEIDVGLNYGISFE